MLSFEDAKKMFEADHYSVRARASWEDASEENFPAAYKFIVGCWNDYTAMVDPDETVPAKVALAFPNDTDAKYFKMLGEFKKIPVDSTREEIYDSWVRKFTRIRQDGIIPDLSILKIFVSQARKHNRNMLDEKMSDDFLVAVISTLLYNMSGGIYQELRIIRIMMKKYSTHEYLRFRPAASNWESSDIDAVLYNFETGETVHNISIKCFGALAKQSVRSWRKNVERKNEKHFKKTGRRRPEVTLWMGILNETDTHLTIYRPEDLAL